MQVYIIYQHVSEGTNIICHYDAEGTRESHQCPYCNPTRGWNFLDNVVFDCIQYISPTSLDVELSLASYLSARDATLSNKMQ